MSFSERERFNLAGRIIWYLIVYEMNGNYRCLYKSILIFDGRRLFYYKLMLLIFNLQCMYVYHSVCLGYIYYTYD